jgi:hypothetical protein
MMRGDKKKWPREKKRLFKISSKEQGSFSKTDSSLAVQYP